MWVIGYTHTQTHTKIHSHQTYRARMSWRATNIACPMCKPPVTLGGGMGRT